MNNKPYKVRNANLGEEIRKAENSEGFLVMISRLNNKTLIHYWYTEHFERNDIPISIMHHSSSLKREMPASTSGEVELGIDEEKKLPPEYRNGKNNKKEQIVRARLKVDNKK